MMCYVSIVDNHTGKFVGGVVVNAETLEAAHDKAAHIARAAGVRSCLETRGFAIPPGHPGAIPADLYGRLLSVEQLEQLGAGPPIRVHVDNDGNVTRAALESDA